VGKISLEDFVRSEGIRDVDFIKTDTDGHDLEVLVSAESAIRECGVLGIMVETNFHGSYGDTANSLHNIDRFMKRHGLMLYGMSHYRYSRASLPAQFVYAAPYQTSSGQPMWGDFVYLRDGAADDYAAIWGDQLSIPKLLKLACLYDLFNVPDCAAELINHHRARLAEVCEPQALLDALTPTLNGRQLNYTDYVDEFVRSFESFYPPDQVPEQNGEVPPQVSAVHDDEREQLVQQVDALSDLVRVLSQDLSSSQDALHEMRRSRLWQWGNALLDAKLLVKRAFLRHD